MDTGGVKNDRFKEKLLIVRIQVPDIYRDAGNELAELISESSLLRLAEQDEVEDVRACIILPPGTDVKKVDRSHFIRVDEPVWAVTAQDERLIMPLYSVEKTGSYLILRDNLEKFVRYRQTLSLRNPNKENILNGKIDFKIKHLKDGTWEIARPENFGHVIFEEGESILLEVKNNHVSPVHISIFDLGLTCGVQFLFPFSGGSERLEPGGSIRIGVRGEIKLVVPPEFPYASEPDNMFSDGIETFKLFATINKISFDALTQKGFQNCTDNGDVHSAGTAYDAIKKMLSHTDWTTVEHTFILRKRTLLTMKRSLEKETKKSERFRDDIRKKHHRMRFIQAQVFQLLKGELRHFEGGFRGDLQYTAKVRIGPPDLAWLTPENEFPDHLLPLREKNLLNVFFYEPNHIPDVQKAVIELPHEGPSTECGFSFRIDKKFPAFEGRIIVAYRSRILQTALLKGEVVESHGMGRPVRLEVEAVVRPTLADLSQRGKFDLALLVNHNSDKRPRLTKLAEDRASIRDIEGIQASIRNIQDSLENAARSIAAGTGGRTLRNSETEALLKFLAYHGRMLYDAIISDQIDAGWIPRHPERIQLVSTHAEAYLPLEFLYDRPMPSPDAVLCPGAEKALQEGRCQECNEANNTSYICPLGFWCLNRVIERHAHDPSYSTIMGSSDYVIQTEPVGDRSILNVFRSCLYAASDRVDSVSAGGRQQVLDTLNSVSNNSGTMVSSWEDWAKEIAARHPTLLILMPHTLEDEILRAPAMEIGASDRLLSGYIKSDYVCISSEDQAPLVALLGCETMVPYSKYMGFVPQFRRNGAAIVICTLTTVLGRHVVPIARELIEEIKTELEHAGGSTTSFGDVLLHVRQKVMLKGLPVVLSLVAYGDADWQLGR